MGGTQRKLIPRGRLKSTGCAPVPRRGRRRGWFSKIKVRDKRDKRDKCAHLAWGRPHRLRKRSLLGAEGIPQRLKPNSLQSIYVRAEARTLQGMKRVWESRPFGTEIRKGKFSHTPEGRPFGKMSFPQPVQAGDRWSGVFQVVKTAQSRERAGRTLLKALSQYSCPTRVARCGFPLEKTTKRSSLRSTPIAKLLR
jgi:hypothetical protein